MNKATEIFNNCKSVRVYLNSWGEKKVQFNFDSFALTCGDNGHKLPSFGVSDQADKNGAGVALINPDEFTTKLAEVKEFLQSIKATDEQIDKAYNEDVILYEEKAESETKEANKTGMSGRSSNMNIEEIVNKTCEYFGLTREELMSNTRRRDVALPRQVAIYACRYLTGLSLSVIGSYFHKKHSTVLYACNVVEALLDVDERVAAAVEAICNEL